jgi:NAD(P)-dependent dehydrogenase (short-subunit alcohol dehydrogenase family)
VIARQSSLDDVTEQDWDLQNQVNLKASFFLCRAAAAAMREQGQGGRLITFASQGWWTGGFGGSVVYSATKGGVVSMTRGLARTYGPHGITANCIAPGAVRTSMGTEGVSSELREAITTATPLGRWAEPREIAGAVVFLASNHASYITGATLNISGGWLMY